MSTSITLQKTKAHTTNISNKSNSKPPIQPGEHKPKNQSLFSNADQRDLNREIVS
jgi:hypothetical protein